MDIWQATNSAPCAMTDSINSSKYGTLLLVHKATNNFWTNTKHIHFGHAKLLAATRQHHFKYSANHGFGYRLDQML